MSCELWPQVPEYPWLGSMWTSTVIGYHTSDELQLWYDMCIHG